MSNRDQAAVLDQTAYRAALASFQRITASNVAEAMLRTDSNAEHRRLAAFTRELDEAGLGIDDHINGFVLYQRDGDPDWARKSPSEREASSRRWGDPWANDEPVTLDGLRRALARHLAKILVERDSEAVRIWAVNVVASLDAQGFHVDEAVSAQVQELKPGSEYRSFASEPPF